MLCYYEKRRYENCRNQIRCKGTTKKSIVQIFRQKNEICLHNFVVLTKWLSVAGYCDCTFEGFPLRVAGRRYNKKMTYASLYAIFLHFPLSL